MSGVIYVLFDSRDPHHYRYVGKTELEVQDRLSQHLYQSVRSAKTHKNCWIRAVISSGSRVCAHVIEANPSNLSYAEKRWIAALREAGYRLTNATDGGDGLPSSWWTPERRAAHSEWWTEERREAAKAVSTEMWTAEFRERHVERLRSWWTEERRLAKSEQNYQMWTDERREALRQRNYETWTIERREVASQFKKDWFTDEQRQINGQLVSKAWTDERRASLSARSREWWTFERRVQQIEKNKKLAKIRRRCLDCGLTSTPGAIGSHLKKSQHTGWEPAVLDESEKQS